MKKIMICVGHSFKEKGAYNSKLNMHEYDLCMDVATELFKRESDENIDLVLKSRNKSYSELPSEINSYYPDCVIELHLNSFTDVSVQGTVHLYYGNSLKGKEIAEILQQEAMKEFNFRNRGIVGTNNNDRGNLILSKTKAPCVITEPFFLSDKDLTVENINILKEKYVNYLEKSIKKIAEIL